MKRIELSTLPGNPFWPLQIVGSADSDRHGKAHYWVICHVAGPDHPKRFRVRGSSLTRTPGFDKKGKFRGPTKSCGCMAERARRNNIKRMAAILSPNECVKIWKAYHKTRSFSNAFREVDLRRKFGRDLARYITPQVVQNVGLWVDEFLRLFSGTAEDYLNQFIRQVSSGHEDRRGNTRRKGELTPSEVKNGPELVFARNLWADYGILDGSGYRKVQRILDAARSVLELESKTKGNRKKRQKQRARSIGRAIARQREAEIRADIQDGIERGEYEYFVRKPEAPAD